MLRYNVSLSIISNSEEVDPPAILDDFDPEFFHAFRFRSGS